MRRFLVLLLALVAAPALAAPPLVLAAASLQESLNAAADAWAAQHHDRPILSFASSSALAKQVDAGAPADIFISADTDWADHVEKNGAAVAGSRRNIASNELVLIAPARSTVKLRLASGVDLAPALGNGRLALADPDTVPAGKYGKASLKALGAWPGVEKRLASAENVRAALALVARGEAPLGIVYRTDALAEKGVRIVDTFPPSTHPPIVYPMVVLKRSSTPVATAFAGYLTTPDARAIFERHGFRVP